MQPAADCRDSPRGRIVLLARLLRLELSDLSPSRSDELLVRVGVPGQTPASVRRLGQKDPGAVHQRGIGGRLRDDGREPFDHGELLITIEAPAFVRTWTRT